MFALLSLPSPLHPAVVHFPIVLILLGTVAAVTAVFTRRWNLPALAAVMLALGAAGAVVAVQTGEREGEMVGETPAIERLLDQHEDWAERTQTAAIVTAVLAIAAVFTRRWAKIARTAGVITALAAMAATWCVMETGHYGGQLVYRHGAGVNLAPAGTTETPGAAATTGKTRRQPENDDD